MSVLAKLKAIRFQKSCAGKQKHKSQGAAEAHLRALAQLDGARMKVYLCGFCNKWHVGHAGKNRGKKERRA